MKTIIAATIAVALASIPAEATIGAPVMKVTGEQFYTQCTNPPPGHETTVVAVCEAYIAGIADGLEVAGQMCVGPRMTADRLFPITLNWVRSHAMNGGYPARIQIATGLRTDFPCQAVPQARRPSLDEQMDQFEKLVKFMTTVKAALALFNM
jgi:Rap1a immunity proteins